MKKRILVSVMLISAVLFVVGCAQKDVVKKEEGLVPATSQKLAESKKDTVPQTKTKTPDSIATAKAPAAIGSSVASQQGKAQQTSLQSLYFGFDEYVLTNESRNILQASFKTLVSKPSVQITGHCDERGSSEYNLALGEKRARAAQNYLVTLGYPADKVSTISYGKEQPADKGNNEAAWAKNRRDEFKIVK